MLRTAGKQREPKTGGRLQENRFTFIFLEAGKTRILKISCFLLVKSKWRPSWVKCAFKSVKRLEVIPIKREATRQRPSAILDAHGQVVWRPVVSIFMTSPFSDSIVFSVHTGKQRFQKSSFSNRSTLESVF